MNTISISVSGTDYETINITLTDAEVKSLYESNKDLKAKIEQMTKDKESVDRTYKYVSDTRDELQKEVNQAHALFSALGVDKEHKDENAYSTTKYDIGTRMALFLSKKG
jgi:mevalonate kinase